MKAIIKHVYPDQTVDFSCAAGDATAVWRGNQGPPVVGGEYHVEMDVNAVIMLDRNATLAPDAKPRVEVTDGSVQVTGLVEHVYEDSVVALRLAPDCIFLVEFDGAPPESGVKLCIKVPPALLELTPFGL